MLSATRKFAKSWVAAVLIGLLVISFAIFGINDVFTGNYSDDVVKAGSRAVSGPDFRREFDNFRKNAEEQSQQQISLEQAAEFGLDKRVMEEIATREAFGEMLAKIGIRPSDRLLGLELRKIPAFFNPISGAFDRALYEQRLGENGLTPARFDTIMRDQIAESHTVSAIVNGLRAPRAYSALGAIYELEARDIGYFVIDPRSVTAPDQPTDAQLEAFMQEKASQLTRPEFRVLTVVAFSPSMVTVDASIDEAEVQKRFEFRKDTVARPETRSLVQIPARDAATAQAVAARLTQGEDPAAIARSIGVEAINYVDRPQSAIADKRVAAAAFGLQPGEVSAAIQGDLGVAVVKVLKVTPGQTVTLDQIRPQIEAELRKDAAAEKVYAQSQAYEDARSQGDNLIDAAKKAGAPALSIGPVSQQGVGQQGQPVAGVTQRLLETAYSLPAGGESEIQEAGDGEYFAVRVERIIPPALPELAEVKGDLTRVWMMTEMLKRLQTRADGFAERLRKGESLETVAAAAGARAARAAGLDRQNAASNTALSRNALLKAFSAEPGEVFTAEHTQFGLVVAKVEAVRPPSSADLAQITEDTRPQVTMALFRDLGAATRKAARGEVGVKIYPDKARSALGLPPLADSEKAAGAAGATETAK